MIAIAASSPAPVLSMPASLFSACGKLAVEIMSLGDDRAAVRSDRRPPVGSFAFLVRNGVKVPALVAWRSGDRIGLSFEEAIADERRAAAFRDAAPARSRRARAMPERPLVFA